LRINGLIALEVLNNFKSSMTFTKKRKKKEKKKEKAFMGLGPKNNNLYKLKILIAN
jgi:hypothetical protein